VSETFRLPKTCCATWHGASSSSFADAGWLLAALYGIHALDTMDAAVAHGLAAAYMGATETTAWLQKHLYTQKQNR